MRKRLVELLDEISKVSVVVVGDIMLDEYIIGDSNRISPEVPHPVIKEKERKYNPGGAANVAVSIAALGAQSRLFGIIGDDHDGEKLRTTLETSGIDSENIFTVPGRPTTRKTRLVARGSQVLRVDNETTEPIDNSLEKHIVERISELSENIVVVSDYAKGMVRPGLVEKLTGSGKRVIVDPKSSDFSTYKGAYLIKPNFTEFCSAAGCENIPYSEIEEKARWLMKEYDIENLLVTLASDGMALVEQDRPISFIHTRGREVYDITGAGDTVSASVAAAVAVESPLPEAGYLASIAAGIVVGKHHVATATPEEIISYSFGPLSSEKIVDNHTVIKQINELKKEGKKIVFTNGCFDLLHFGHISYLKQARSEGDVLVVGLNTDRSVHALKGENRPIIPETERSHVLAALECIDFVVLFDEDTPLNLISDIRPDVLVKGADYTREQVVGHDIVESYGGSVSLIPFVESNSTSRIIKRIKENL